MLILTKSAFLQLQPLDIAGYLIEGTDGNDVLNGSAYADDMYGFRGDDRLYAGAGSDSLFGGDGNDTLSGGAGNDLLDGGLGNDFLQGGAGADQNIGGAGYDTLNYVGSSAGVSVNLAWNQGIGGDAQGDTFSSIEKIIGSNHNDILINDSAASVSFDGGAGNDGIRGGSALDVLNGGSGNDWLEGGRGLDVLTGGSGNDTFVFNVGDGPDLVYDFQPGVDKIALDDGFTAPYMFGSSYRGSFGTDGQLLTGADVSDVQFGGYGGGYYGARDQLFFDTDDHQLYQLTSGAYGTAQTELLATFANGVQLTTSDFIFV